MKPCRQWLVSGKVAFLPLSPWSYTHRLTSSASLWKRRWRRWSRALLQTLPLRRPPKQVGRWMYICLQVYLPFFLIVSLYCVFLFNFWFFCGFNGVKIPALPNRLQHICLPREIVQSEMKCSNWYHFSLSPDVHVEPHKKQLHVTLAYHFQSNHHASLEKLAKGVDISLGCDWQAVLFSRDIRFANHEVS